MGADPLDQEELPAGGGSGHEPHRSPTDAKLTSHEPCECLVRRPIDRGRGHPNAQDPVGDPIDPIGATPGRESNGEPDLGCAQRSPAQKVRMMIARTINTMVGERSIIPIGGRTRRTGARIGSVSPMSQAET